MQRAFRMQGNSRYAAVYYFLLPLAESVSPCCSRLFPMTRTLLIRRPRFAFAPGVGIRTCSAEDLIILKIFASRPLDIRDAEGIAVRNADRLDWIYIENELRQLAEAKEDAEILRTLARLRKL